MVGTEADVTSGDAGTAAGEAGADADGFVEGDIGTAAWRSSYDKKLTLPLIIQSPFEEMNKLYISKQ